MRLRAREAGIEQLIFVTGRGKTSIVEHFDMAFELGTITALIGPTGSGKSTFLRTLNRMNDRVPGFERSGNVTLDGAALSN